VLYPTLIVYKERSLQGEKKESSQYSYKSSVIDVFLNHGYMAEHLCYKFILDCKKEFYYELNYLVKYVKKTRTKLDIVGLLLHIAWSKQYKTFSYGYDIFIKVI